MDLLNRLEFFALDAHPVHRQEATPLHVHGSFIELVVITSGQGKHLLGQSAFPIEAGDTFVIPVGVLHGYSDCIGLGLYNVMFDPMRLTLPMRNLRQVPGIAALFSFEPELRVQHGFSSRLRLEPEALSAQLGTLERLHHECARQETGFDLLATALFIELMVDLGRRYAKMTTPMSEGLIRLSPLLDWLEGHYKAPQAVEALARRARMSKKTLNRYFRECLGTTPINYLIDLRMRKAQHLLRETEVTVSEVATRVGIDDANYFARLFRKFSGVEPSAYRRQHSCTSTE